MKDAVAPGGMLSSAKPSAQTWSDAAREHVRPTTTRSSQPLAPRRVVDVPVTWPGRRHACSQVVDDMQRDIARVASDRVRVVAWHVEYILTCVLACLACSTRSIASSASRVAGRCFSVFARPPGVDFSLFPMYLAFLLTRISYQLDEEECGLETVAASVVADGGSW